MDTAKQMEMAFMEEGGLTDDGTTMDPVSGNEVPPGSMAEEVRDDVPAQLSEGEYVVPADVVRFYGVKFFEDLRSEAKSGLMDMEANGRIGGEPVAMTMDNQTGGDLTPEELAALEQVTGMAMGGSVQSPTPYQQPAPVAVGNAMQYSKGGQVLYAQGGVDVQPPVADPTTGVDAGIDPYEPQFGATSGSMFAPGFLIDQQLGTTAPATRTVIMYGPAGEVETLILPAQQARYDELVQMGYSETPVQTTTETTVRQDDDDGQPSSKPTTKPPLDVNEIPKEDLAKTAKGLGVMTNIATAIASSAGLPVAAFINTAAVSQYNDIIDRMNDEGIEHDLTKKGSIFGGESSLYENLADTSGDDNVNFGDTWLGDLLGFDGEAGVQGDNLRDSFSGSRRTGGDDDKPTFAGEDNNKNSSTGATTAQVESATQTSQTANANTDYTPGTDQFDNQVEYDADFYNQGGMVKRRSNKKNKKKQ